jgi:hypothetical protein
MTPVPTTKLILRGPPVRAYLWTTRCSIAAQPVLQDTHQARFHERVARSRDEGAKTFGERLPSRRE